MRTFLLGVGLLFCFAGSGTGQELERHDGRITAIKSLKAGRARLTIKERDKENEFSINRRTLVYQTTARNFSLLNKPERLTQIVQDSKQYRKSLQELSESQSDAVMGVLSAALADKGRHNQASLLQNTRENVRGQKEEKSERGAEQRSLDKNRGALGILSQSQRDFAEQEEQRQERYGSPIRLKKNQDVTLFTSPTEDDTLLVLVLSTQNKSEPAVVDKEKAAKSALDLIEQNLSKMKLDTAKMRLEKFIERYPGTEAAKKATELLKDLN